MKKLVGEQVRLQTRAAAKERKGKPSPIKLKNKCYHHCQTHTHTQTHRHTDTQTHRHTDTDTQTHTQTHRHTDTQTHRHTHRHKHTHRHTDTHRHTHTQIRTAVLSEAFTLPDWRGPADVVTPEAVEFCDECLILPCRPPRFPQLIVRLHQRLCITGVSACKHTHVSE